MSINTYCQYVQGESVYGLVTNYQIGNGLRNWRETNKALFGRTHVRLHPVIPSDIGNLADHFGIDVRILLSYSTGFPLYALSLADKADELARSMCTSNGSAISRTSRHAAFSLPLNKHHKYCPQCVAHGFDTHGKMLWLAEHQLYGVTYCPVHGNSLNYLVAGEGGVNRKYVLPEGGRPLHTQSNEKARYLSTFIVGLFRYLQRGRPQRALHQYYHEWLLINDFLTPHERIRMQRLTKALFDFWRPLFSTETLPIPLELGCFRYIPHLVYDRRPVHYLKHVMLMAFLAKHANDFFSVAPDVTPSAPIAVTKGPSSKQDIDACLVDKLCNGASIRQVAKECGVSVNYLKQLALRKQVTIDRRRQKITQEMERAVWCKAFIGMNRQEIAACFEISVGAVEQIIQSHEGLSAWRKHLRHVDAKRHNRRQLQAFLAAHPQASRNEIKQSTPSYLWLYKHDREWLYAQLPPAQSARYHPSLNWAARDKFLAMKMVNMVKPAASLSAMDRQLGGHAWLTHHASKLPMTLQAAYKKIDAYQRACRDKN